MFLVMIFSDFLVGMFLLLLVEISLQMFLRFDVSSDFFGREMSLERLFGRYCSSDFLAENVSS